MGGGTGGSTGNAQRQSGLSPRGRGNLSGLPAASPANGSIPAWAGEPSSNDPTPLSIPVYPRVGGGTAADWGLGTAPRGLSPRGRGNPTARSVLCQMWRSIPAWAGEPPAPRPPAGGPAVYPRVGGGTQVAITAACRQSGLSPRGRGNPPDRRPVAGGGGSIPAWAGEPQQGGKSCLMTWVYPRVGGGTSRNGSGSEPDGGLSPRGRGNPLVNRSTACSLRSIPAWAGEPAPVDPGSLPPTVYPRVGGGTLPSQRIQRTRLGLSPRGRGNPISSGKSGFNVRSIPAWAGEPPRRASSMNHWRVYPRVGGGTDWRNARPSSEAGLSPRGRGNPIPLALGIARRRSIPAWAGEPAVAGGLRGRTAVYPRVGGGTASRGTGDTLVSGLSPRGRGNPITGEPPPTANRSIPAWAGEPTGWRVTLPTARVYPRVGGGTASRGTGDTLVSGLSPRGRGNRPVW